MEEIDICLAPLFPLLSADPISVMVSILLSSLTTMAMPIVTSETKMLMQVGVSLEMMMIGS